jgi:predicted acylesterase/phospholipase RssA
MPGVFSPMVDDGELLVDGGLMNNVPLDIMQDLAEGGPVIAVDVRPERETAQKYSFGPSLSGWQVLWNRLNPRAQPRPVPSLFGTLLQSITVNETYHLVGKRHRANLFLSPPVAGFSLMDFTPTDQIAEVGYQYARPLIEAWWTARPLPGEQGCDASS